LKTTLIAVVLAALLTASAASAQSGTFALSGLVFDVYTSSGLHSVNYWQPAPVCSLPYATMYVNVNGALIAVLFWGQTLACAAWNHAPATAVYVSGTVSSQRVGPGAEDVQTILSANYVQ